MGGLKDHFFGDKPYPDTPGYKAPGTSKDAARATTGRAETLRQRVLEAIEKAGNRGLTPDEAAAALGETVLAVRPRFSELKALDKIYQTGARRANASGLKANAWKVMK